jgi:Rrf2 family protein
MLMRISAKARYALASLVSIAGNCDISECTTLVSLAEKLEISKIYLEQVFSLLKRAGIVISIKGAQGGYYLAKPAKDITAFEIFQAIETTLFEKAEETVSGKNENIEKAIRETVFNALDNSIKTALSRVSLEDILNESNGGYYMYYL